MTPEGLKKKTRLTGQSITPQTGKRLNTTILVLMAVTIAYLLFDNFSNPVAVDQPSTEVAAVVDQTEENLEVEAEIPRKSIAVLPFINRSQLLEDEYFTDGMHDELLTRLAHITALKVTSRTSVMRYRDTDKSLPEIARELSVATILEGGVQRVGKQVRINVQLINAHTDEHLWAEIFDRELTAENLFSIQSEISKAIAAALQAELSPVTLASIEEVPTDNVEAFDLFLRAIKERNIWRGSDTFEAMKSLLERAVALDPNFLRAQILLAETYGVLLWIGADPDRIYGAKALELTTDIRRRWPDRIEGRLALGHYYYTVERDYSRALVEYQAVEEVFPNDPEMLLRLSSSLKRLDRGAEFLRYARRVVELDPMSILKAGELAWALQVNGRIEESLAYLEEGVIRFPEASLLADRLAYDRLRYLGDVEGYLAHGDSMVRVFREPHGWEDEGSILTWLLYGRDGVNAALEHADTRQSDEYDWGAADLDSNRALILRLEGRADEAQVAADRALGFVRSWIEAGRPFPDTRTKLWYISAAFYAAVAGDLDAVEKYRASAANEPANDWGIGGFTVFIDSNITAILGDASAGWAMLVPSIGTFWPEPTAELLAVHPLFRYLYGDVPGYQELIMQAEIAE
jgi:TolB-like protein